ncbi:demethoxyubiquinone hydroxylase family protein [Sphingomonas sp. OTU376]|uniref:demethoxyubiquinone hydroxylase family protein n=1 Tax=Sphingomonas sp. OTU376 TaxID=3043863 RepID=UPI00313BDE3A
MALIARLNIGETLGDRVMKVDHAGEHGAVCIYAAQRWFARWRAPEMVDELDEFLAHRAQFLAELQRRERPRCRSYFLCAVGGFALGAATGLAGRDAIAATTVAIERVVLHHMQEQLQALDGVDKQAADTLRAIIVEEQEHHDRSAARIREVGMWPKLIDPVVAFSTEAVIWLGMRL